MCVNIVYSSVMTFGLKILPWYNSLNLVLHFAYILFKIHFWRLRRNNMLNTTAKELNDIETPFSQQSNADN